MRGQQEDDKRQRGDDGHADSTDDRRRRAEAGLFHPAVYPGPDALRTVHDTARYMDK